MSSRAFFEAVGDALVNFLPPSMRDFSSYHTRANFKAWYGEARREHYEVQRIPRRRVLEIGFHSEHPRRERNDEVIERLVAAERAWRRALGRTVEVGPFLGAQSGSWRRISEVWGDTPDPDAAVEAAERLALYIRTLEPLRTG